jgi:hypothetical protein
VALLLQQSSLSLLILLMFRKRRMSRQEETVDSQIIYKLATIETQVKSIDSNLLTAIKRLEEKIEDHSKHQEQSMELAKERSMLNEKKTEAVEKRVTQLEAWKSQLITKMGFVVSGVSVFWLVFGKSIENGISSVF